MQNEVLIEIRLKISAGTATEEERDIWEKWISQPHISEKQFVSDEEIELWFEMNKEDEDWEAFLEGNKDKLIDYMVSEEAKPYIAATADTETAPVVLLNKPGRNFRQILIAIIITGVIFSLAANLILNKKEVTESSKQLSSDTYDSIRAPIKSNAALTLPDGTKVWLNSNTVLRYPKQFTSNTRRVELNGEACFEVAKNEQQPFIVSTEGSVTKVLGTIFNVDAYDGSAVQKISLLEGAIVISKINGDTSKQLKPGEQGILTAKGISVQKMIRPDEATAWKRDSFAFDQVSLTDIMSELAAYYGVKVKYEKGVKNKLYTIGSTSRNVPLAKILRGMERTGGMRFKPNKDSIQPGETILILKNE